MFNKVQRISVNMCAIYRRFKKKKCNLKVKLFLVYFTKKKNSVSLFKARHHLLSCIKFYSDKINFLQAVKFSTVSIIFLLSLNPREKELCTIYSLILIFFSSSILWICFLLELKTERLILKNAILFLR